MFYFHFFYEYLRYMKTGYIINNKYIGVCQLGKGTFSEVWLCLQYEYRDYVAVKIFTDNDVAEHELEMIELIKKNNAPNCLTYIEKFYYKNMLYIVQPLMAGSVYDIMKAQYPHGLPLASVKKIMYDVSRALEYLHGTLKVMHTDIKPENILLSGYTINVNNIIIEINKCLDALGKHASIETIARNIKKKLNIDVDMTNNDISESEMGTEFTDRENSSDNTIDTASDIHSEHTSKIDQSFLDSFDDYSELNNAETLERQNMINIMDDKYIMDPHVLLGDFGNSILIKNSSEFGDLQTRHYRSPEIILRFKSDEKSDIWAIGCTFYELVTNKVLFNPFKSPGVTTDRQHLNDIQCIVGSFPNFLKHSRKQDVFFRTDGTIKSINSFNYVGIDNILSENCYLKKEDHEYILNTLLKLLDYDVSNRPSASECIKLFM